MVKQTVEKFELFMCRRHLPDDLDAVGFYMLRVHSDPIPTPPSLDQAKAVLPACFETGTVGSKPLNALERMLAHVYIPMLMLQGKEEVGGGGKGRGRGGGGGGKGEGCGREYKKGHSSLVILPPVECNCTRVTFFYNSQSVWSTKQCRK